MSESEMDSTLRILFSKLFHITRWAELFPVVLLRDNPYSTLDKKSLREILFCFDLQSIKRPFKLSIRVLLNTLIFSLWEITIPVVVFDIYWFDIVTFEHLTRIIILEFAVNIVSFWSWSTEIGLALMIFPSILPWKDSQSVCTSRPQFVKLLLMISVFPDQSNRIPFAKSLEIIELLIISLF